jgi:hypothetical protein
VASQIAEGVAIAIIVLGNVVWYQAKVFIQSQGLPAPWFWFHFSNLESLRQLALSANAAADRNRAKNLLWALRTSLFLVLFVAFPLFFWSVQDTLDIEPGYAEH